MPTPTRILRIIGAACLVYLLAVALFGTLPLAHWLITVTAIDHWHPNWPDPATVDDIAQNHLPILATSILLLAIIILLTLHFTRRLTTSSSGVAANTPVTLGGPPMMLRQGVAEYRPSREEFAADLETLLVETGAGPQQAKTATEEAMDLSAASKNPADWASQVRDTALGLAGFSGQAQRVHSTEPHLDQTAAFLRAYGFRAAQIKQVEGSDSSQVLNYTGLIVWYRTSAIAAETALMELLIYAHQAHLASMEDIGNPTQRETLSQHTKILEHVCTKLALRGFVPPELDAEIGRDGTATAEELQRWAIAQVVAICSPLTQTPLPTVERIGTVTETTGTQS